ncbi:MAG: inorganic phosphate transporter [Candidatus Thorarchaeota archaeon]|nr:inorganic phosphate transporter [Candidatus Thorarchaeota archaeon]
MEPLLLLAVLLICFIVAFAIGSNDETMSPAVGARVFTVRAAVVIGGAINIIGAISLGGGVSEKVGSDLVGGQILTTSMIFAILISMAIWLLVASATKGLPISTTQCIVGSVIGVAIGAPLLGIAGWGISSVDWLVVAEIFIGWVLSPVVGFVIAGLVFALVRRIQKRAAGLSAHERQEKLAAYALALFLIITGLSRGGNDVANAVAPLVNMADFQGTVTLGSFTIGAIMIPLIVGGIGIAMGLAVVGRKVIKTLATEVVTLTPVSALSASISVSLVMFVGTFFGLPLSGTHVLVAALIAVGWVSREPVKKKQVNNILISWVITVPISAILGIGMLFLTQMIF